MIFLQSLLSFSAAIICLFIGYSVYARGRHKLINIYFFIYNILIFLWSSGDFVIISLLNQPILATWYDRFSQIGGILLSPVFVIFSHLLSGKTPKKIFSYKMVRIFVFAAMFLLFTVPTSYLIEKVELNPFKEIPGALLGVEILLYLSSYIYGLCVILKAKKTAPPSERNRLTYFSIGTIMILTGVLLWFTILSFFTGHSTVIIYFFEVSYALLTAYAILRYHLMDINIVLKKTVLYTILSTLITGIYVAIIILFETLFHKITGYTSILARIFAGFVIAFSFLPLRNRIEFFIDRYFFRTKYDYQQALLVFSQSLTSFLDLRELLELITMVISSTIKTSKSSIMLLNKSTNIYSIISFTGLPKVCRDWQFNKESALISWLLKEQTPVQREFLEKPLHTENFKIIAEMRLLRSVVSVPLFYKQDLIGVINIGEKLSGESYSKEDLELLHTLGSEAAIAIANANLYTDLEKNYLQTVQALAQAIEAKDQYTRGHSERVTQLSIKIAKILGLPRQDIDDLKYACILHDIGKIGIEIDTLNKPGKLTAEEYEQVKKHSVKGEEIIAPVAFLERIKPIIRHHHERYDGKGYPDGLNGENIPFLARIIALADTYDAMTSNRPYRPPLSAETALEEIKKCSGTQFDPQIVEAFLKIYHSIEQK